jgi:CubicO group peptidase (beta-lactamase class C family)
MREYLVPGAAISVVRDGRVEYLAGFGCANEARGIAVDPRQTVFHVARCPSPSSRSRQCSSRHARVVDLHTDVNRYLRGMQVPPGWDRPITLHDLLTHTADSRRA